MKRSKEINISNETKVISYNNLDVKCRGQFRGISSWNFTRFTATTTSGRRSDKSCVSPCIVRINFGVESGVLAPIYF